MADKVLVKAPASSANMGPGFDCLGTAWRLYNEIEFEVAEKTVITGCDEEFCNESNMAFTAFNDVLAMHGKEKTPLKINFRKIDIPVSRGLGSSSALIVAGVLAANELFDLGMTDEDKLTCATRLEGHPDNVAPALFGGLTASAMAENEVLMSRLTTSYRLHFYAVVPDFKLSTSLARSVLPWQYEKSDAVKNIALVSMMISGLAEGNMAKIRLACGEKIHQPYRKSLIPGYDTVEAICSGMGCAVCISGAGSTMLVMSETDVEKELRAIINEAFPNWGFMQLSMDRNGATTERI